MQTNEAVIVIATICSFAVLWTTSIAAGIWWLSAQFSKNRAATYETAANLKREFTDELGRHDRRIRNLEFWRVAKDGFIFDAPDNDDPPRGNNVS